VNEAERNLRARHNVPAILRANEWIDVGNQSLGANSRLTEYRNCLNQQQRRYEQYPRSRL
jgi:hypothetical protein